MLRFKAETRVPLIDCAPFSCNGAIQTVASVELNGWLGGIDFHRPAACWIVHLCCQG